MSNWSKSTSRERWVGSGDFDNAIGLARSRRAPRHPRPAPGAAGHRDPARDAARHAGTGRRDTGHGGTGRRGGDRGGAVGSAPAAERTAALVGRGAPPTGQRAPQAARDRPHRRPPHLGADASAPGGGLPRRVPMASGFAGDPVAQTGSTPVDADELPRRLGGFARGLREGRQDAEAETGTGSDGGPIPGPRRTGDHSDSEPSEEARG